MQLYVQGTSYKAQIVVIKHLFLAGRFKIRYEAIPLIEIGLREAYYLNFISLCIQHLLLLFTAHP